MWRRRPILAADKLVVKIMSRKTKLRVNDGTLQGFSGRKAKSAKKLREARRAKPTGHHAGLDGPSGRFWTQWVEPGEIIHLADNINISQLVIKNNGPGIVAFYAGYGDQLDLLPGRVRVTTAYGRVTVEAKHDKPALVELEVMPRSK
jgi:hypothetical protein